MLLFPKRIVWKGSLLPSKPIEKVMKGASFKTLQIARDKSEATHRISSRKLTLQSFTIFRSTLINAQTQPSGRAENVGNSPQKSRALCKFLPNLLGRTSCSLNRKG
jgi:hypothetical protein